MGRLSVLLKVVLLFSLITINYAYAEFPGVTPGSFSVTDSGQANYELPITTPVGVAGMKPNLSVSYNSSNGNGILGVGFQLNGFRSSIHRCTRSHATDLRAGNLTYTNDDRVCLDGHRLINTKGTPWTQGAEYSTEIESFSKIIYRDGKFLVYSRDGMLTWYAHKINLSNKTVRWLKSSEHDRYGNVIRYVYKHFGSERWLPSEVYWTGKGTELGNRKVEIIYRARQDKRISYEYGVKFETNQVVDTITTKINNKQVKKYKFFYQKSEVSNLSRLIYAVQYGADGTQLPKHEFTWNNTGKGFNPNGPKLPALVYDYNDIRQSDSCGTCNDGYSVEVKRGDFLDVNNDGYVDFVEAYRGEDSNTIVRNIYKNTGTTWTKLAGQNQKPPIPIRDYYINRSKSTGKGEMVQQATYADVNGDGFPDIVRAFRNGTTYIHEVRLNNPGTFSWGAPTANNFNPPTAMWDYNHLGKGKPMQLAYLEDVNGDGLPDWVASYLNKSGGELRKTWINTGSRWEYTGQHYNLPLTAIIDDYRDAQKMDGSPVKRTEFVDINGDGLVDLVQGLYSPDKGVDRGKSYRKVWLNTGVTWVPAPSTYELPDYINDYSRVNEIINGQPTNDSVQRRGDFIDINGDGLVDWVRSYRDFRNGIDYKWTLLNTGKGWVTNTNYNLPGEVIRNYYKHNKGDPNGPQSGSFFDVNRDGLIDWVISHKNRKYETVRKTFLNTGTGWTANKTDYLFPNIFVDNVLNEGNKPMHFGGLMDINGDGALDYLMATKPLVGNNILKTYLGNAKPADMVVKIKNSLKAETDIIYKPLNDKSVYRQILANTAYHFRRQKVTGPMPLVSKTLQSNGIGTNKNELSYFYYEVLSDAKRGNLGFVQRRVWDKQRTLLKIKDFYQDFPATGITKRELVYRTTSITPTGWTGPDSELLKYKVNFLKHVSDLNSIGSVLDIDKALHINSRKFTYAPRIRRVRDSEYELGQGHIRTKWIDYRHDAYLNPIFVTEAVFGSFKTYENIDWDNDFWKRTGTTYSNDENNWLIGLPTDVYRGIHSPGQSVQALPGTHFTYNARGKPLTKITAPNRPDFRLTEAYGYDNYGNQDSITVSGHNFDTRNTTLTYDSIGLHVIKTKNALGQITRSTMDNTCDLPKTITDLNGLVTTFIYDVFCRQKQINYPDSTWAKFSFYYNSFGNIFVGGDQAQYGIKQTFKAKPYLNTYYDMLKRVVKIEKEGFDGRKILTRTSYNSEYELVGETLPYYVGDSVSSTRYTYDAMSRVIKITAPDNTNTTKTYNGLTTILTNHKGQTHTEVRDLLGRVISVDDADNKRLTYTYDSRGNLVKTRDPSGNKIEWDYDHFNRKTSMNDPDMNLWSYEYDLLGQLLKQTDAKSQVTKIFHDKLGRMIRRKTNEGFSYWKYDTAQNGIGKIANTTGPNGYKLSYTYDAKSRVKQTYETIDGKQARSFTSYNNNGQIHEMRYPGPKDGHLNGGQNRLIHSYNARGYLARIQDSRKVNGQSVLNDLWVVEQHNARGQITQEKYGNGVNINRKYHPQREFLWQINSARAGTTIQDLAYWHDPLGNLTLRQDNVRGTSETFQYDDLNRLTRTVTTPPANIGPQYTVDYDYDGIGNIIYRSDVGTLNYGENGYGPHAVTSVENTDNHNVPTKTRNPYDDYEYDLNGNLTISGPTSVGWTSFNKPKHIFSTINGKFRDVGFTYGSDSQRITKSSMSNDKYVRFYGDGKSEYIETDNKAYWKYYINLGKSTLEIKYKEVTQNNTLTYNQIQKHYIFKDQLGSPDVIVNNSGNLVEKLSFNPWGKRRNWKWNEFDQAITSRTNIGFTGHKMDDEVGFVNMKARIYDPIIGRFLSADSKIPDLKSTQSFNRYSYVRNNPLSFTDPTGHGREDHHVRNGTVRFDCGECRDGAFNKTKVRIKISGKWKNVGTFNTRQLNRSIQKNPTRRTSQNISDSGVKFRSSSTIGATIRKQIKHYEGSIYLHRDGTVGPGPGHTPTSPKSSVGRPVGEHNPHPEEPGIETGFNFGFNNPNEPAPPDVIATPLNPVHANFIDGQFMGENAAIADNTSDVDAAQNQPGYDPSRDTNNDGVMNGPGDRGSPGQVGGSEGPTADSASDPNAGDGNHGGVGGTGVGGGGAGNVGGGDH